MENVNFESIGGIEENIQYLKDNILLAWKYNNILKKFNTKPPRGVLFHGPPGTGKTLTAAALANECKINRQKVTFFQHNATECLNMWLGESEKKIRELFKTAYLNRPSIIFFDEFDALAPTRSSRMDHVHCSLVSTLLTLMDGLKSPTDVVVIGATNRLDEIDPALRRPGRFDKELYFPPPNLKARRAILDIHTRYWKTDVSCSFLDYIAENTVGYCGADLEGLCKDALMCAMKRCDASEQRITVKNLTVHEDDFIQAKSKCTPTCLRTSISPVSSLREEIRPLLKRRLNDLIEQMEKIYSFKFLFPKPRMEMAEQNMLFCPRVILTGSADQGATNHLAPAILHRLEHLPVIIVDFTTFFSTYSLSDASCAAEANMTQILASVMLQQPCILYMPDITAWWARRGNCVRIFQTMLNYFETTEVLLLATAHVGYTELPNCLMKIFDADIALISKMTNPTKWERLNFFQPLFEKELKLICCTQTESGMNADDGASFSEKVNEAYKEPGIKRRCSRSSSSLGFIPDVSLEENLEDTHQPQRIKKICLHENEYNKKIRSNSEQSTSCMPMVETRELTLPVKETLFCTYPAEGCKVMQDESQQLLQRLVNSTEDNTVRRLEIIYNKISMAIKMYACYNNYSYLKKDLEDIIKQCEEDNSGVSE